MRICVIIPHSVKYIAICSLKWIHIYRLCSFTSVYIFEYPFPLTVLGIIKCLLCSRVAFEHCICNSLWHALLLVLQPQQSAVPFWPHCLRICVAMQCVAQYRKEIATRQCLKTERETKGKQFSFASFVCISTLPPFRCTHDLWPLLQTITNCVRCVSFDSSARCTPHTLDSRQSMLLQKH